MNDSYFGKHLSMSEWARRAGLPASNAIVQEDSDKRARLDVLAEVLRIPILHTLQFDASEVIAPSERFLRFARGADSQLYAARGRSSDPAQPVLRARGKTVDHLAAWIGSVENIDAYTFSFEQHVDAELAAIFVVGPRRVAGEAIEGSLLALNSGNFRGSVLGFELDAEGEWKYSTPGHASLERFLRQALACIRVDDGDARSALERRLLATFFGAYVAGYFEVISSDASGLIFVDYNRLMVSDLPPLLSAGGQGAGERILVVGRAGSGGHVTGRARVVRSEEVGAVRLAPTDVLVCEFTDPIFLPLMTSAAAVVTDIGGVLSHAAVVCRELGIPCIVGTGSATATIPDGDLIEVNANEGVVRLAEPG